MIIKIGVDYTDLFIKVYEVFNNHIKIENGKIYFTYK